MVKTISELKAQSAEVKNASAIGENTATRVGQLFGDIVEHVEQYENTKDGKDASQDAQMQSLISAEESRAEGEERGLQNQIHAEKIDRQTADTYLGNLIQQESSARETADENIRTALANETARAQAAEQELAAAQIYTSKIKDGAVTTPKIADGAVTYEKTDIIAQELGTNMTKVPSQKVVTDAISKEETERKADIDGLTVALGSETINREQADEAESNRAKGEERGLQNEIHAEKIDRKTADTYLSNLIQQETERAMAAEEDNATAINAAVVKLSELEEKIKGKNIVLIPHKRIRAGAIGTSVNTDELVDGETWSCAVIDCEGIDRFKLVLRSPSISYNAYAWLDENNIILDCGRLANGEVDVYSGAKTLIVNNEITNEPNPIVEIVSPVSNGLIKDVEKLNNDVAGKVNKVEGKDLSTNDFTDEYKKDIENVGKKRHEESIALPSYTRGYYEIIDNQVSINSGSGKMYEPISLDKYKGNKIVVKNPSAAASSERKSIVTDKEGNILYSILEGHYLEDDFSFVAEEGMKLYLSFLYIDELSINNVIPTTGIYKEIDNINGKLNPLAAIKVKRYVPTNASVRSSEIDRFFIAENVDVPYCRFTDSYSYRLSGNGSGRFIISIPQDIDFHCGSIGLLIPWEVQKNLQIYPIIDGQTSSCFLRANYKSEATGWVYYQQGKTFNRINFPAGTKQVQLRIDANDAEQKWELFLSSKIVHDDDMSIAPVCIMYDGGAWNGSVIDNGETISLWELHHRYNIPYGIGLHEVGLESTLHPIVKADIESGFAHIMMRDAAAIPFYNDSTDTNLVNALRDMLTGVCADSKFVVLAEHKLDDKIYRCMIQLGVDCLRTGASNDYYGLTSTKYGDADLWCLPSTRLGGGAPDKEMMKFPHIIWEHGVGIPPEGDSGSMYVDKIGTNTPALFKWLREQTLLGNVVCFAPADFVAYCKNN